MVVSLERVDVVGIVGTAVLELVVGKEYVYGLLAELIVETVDVVTSVGAAVEELV